MLNVTVTNPVGPGFVTVYPAGVTMPNASNVNFVAGQTVPNAVTVKVGPDGIITLLASAGCPDVIVDVVGYYSGSTGPATSLSGGLDQSCAIVSGGEVQCWGSNARGTLGNGTTYEIYPPSTVVGVSNATSVESGRLVSCAIIGGGTVKCWGSGFYGLMPNGSVSDQLQAITIPGLAGATNIDIGYSHGCAVLAGGTIKCWGSNTYGELGDGTNTFSANPVAVAGLTGATKVAVGDQHTCALIAGGVVTCWGRNDQGQLGDGTTDPSRLTPSPATGFTGATAIAAGAKTTCAIDAGAGVKCWGSNQYGALGAGSGVVSSNTFLNVNGSPNSVALEMGAGHACALLGDGTVNCWGYNDSGQLGNRRPVRPRARSS